ncbi:MAG: glycosyltransferase [Patescibacteria group bacterium]
MILYVINHPFPSSSGFGKRCKRQLTALARKEPVTLLCRAERPLTKARSSDSRTQDDSNLPYHIYRFSALLPHIENVGSTYRSGLYEVVRNLDIAAGFLLKILQVLWKNRKDQVKLYVVSSPLTIPFFCSLAARLFPKTHCFVLEMHDAEPELAMHLKHLSSTSLVVRIELWLERLMCHRFEKLVVTSTTQQELIQKRTGKADQSVYVLPNTVEPPKHYRPTQITQSQPLQLIYSGNLTYDYTVNGLIEFLHLLAHQTDNTPLSYHLTVAGDGDSFLKVQATVEELMLDDRVTLPGRVHQIDKLIAKADIALIPWTEDPFTRTILPTKLIEYMAHGKIIIAPAFGEFRRVLTHRKDAMLYNSLTEVPTILAQISSQPSDYQTLGDEARTLYGRLYRSHRHIVTYTKFIYDTDPK